MCQIAFKVEENVGQIKIKSHILVKNHCNYHKKLAFIHYGNMANYGKLPVPTTAKKMIWAIANAWLMHLYISWL